MIGEGRLGTTRKFVAFVPLTNLMTQAQTATVRFNVDGRPTVTRTYSVPACGSVVVGVHEVLGFGDQNFRTIVSWPMLGSAMVLMRPFDTQAAFDNEVVMPPLAVFR